MNKEEAKRKRIEYQKKKRARASEEGRKITYIILGITLLLLVLMYLIFLGTR